MHVNRSGDNPARLRPVSDRLAVSVRIVILSDYERWLAISSRKFEDRIEALSDRLNESDIQAYYTENLNNLQFLTGFRGTAGGLLVFDESTGTSAEILVDGRYRNYALSLDVNGLSVQLVEDSRPELVDERLKEYGIDSIHFERPEISYDDFLNIKKRIDSPSSKNYGDNWIKEERSKKTEFEVGSIEEAISQTLDVFELIESWLEPGLSERDISRALRRELESRSEGLAFDPLVLSGENTANPHCPSTNRELETDDVLLVDQGMKINGYCSDLTRMFFLGDPDKQFEELYNLSKRAAVEAFQLIRPGRSIAEVTEQAHDLIKDEGYGDHLRHGLGHGVGLNVHEKPSLSSKSEGTFEAGMVVTLEPGIYIDGFGGGRIEHMVLVEEGGPRLLDEADEYLQEAL